MPNVEIDFTVYFPPEELATWFGGQDCLNAIAEQRNQWRIET